jgi:hypothetical protein
MMLLVARNMQSDFVTADIQNSCWQLWDPELGTMFVELALLDP